MYFSIVLVLGFGLTSLWLYGSEQEPCLPKLILEELRNNTVTDLEIRDNLRSWGRVFWIDPVDTARVLLPLGGKNCPTTEYFEKDVLVKTVTMVGHFLVRDTRNVSEWCTCNLFIEEKVGEKPAIVVRQFNDRTDFQHTYPIEKTGQIKFALSFKKVKNEGLQADLFG